MGFNHAPFRRSRDKVGDVEVLAITPNPYLANLGVLGRNEVSHIDIVAIIICKNYMREGHSSCKEEKGQREDSYTEETIFHLYGLLARTHLLVEE
ncbi:hypothetical protein PYJP_17020 [Pyrofollis japonicus]|nr:hypothetical protein PYJP_17020 [Pyrofollis japonicus]